MFKQFDGLGSPCFFLILFLTRFWFLAQILKIENWKFEFWPNLKTETELWNRGFNGLMVWIAHTKLDVYAMAA